MELGDFNLALFALTDKVAIITGGNTGLGQAYSVALAAAGADIFVPSLGPDNSDTAQLVAERGRRYHFMDANLTAEGAPQAIVEACLAEYGRIDILINNAGICLLDDVEGFDRSKWDPMFALNVTAAFELSHAVIPTMRAQHSGKIINICSLFSYLGGQWSPAYAASKHAMAGLTKAYCDELAADNIQVNGLAPGYYATAITEATRSNLTTNQRVLDHIPAGRWGDPADLMGPMVFLCSDASNYVNGQLLVVDGGYLVR